MTENKSSRSVLAALFLVMILSFWLPLSCRDGQKKRFVKIFFPGGQSVTAELAVTDAERARGLMFRKVINFDEGMLFIFEEEGYHSFWMKNTLIELDILWLGANKTIIHIEENVPPCREDPCPSYGPWQPAGFVLELKAGSVKKYGLKLYDRLEFVLPRDPEESSAD